MLTRNLHKVLNRQQFAFDAGKKLCPNMEDERGLQFEASAPFISVNYLQSQKQVFNLSVFLLQTNKANVVFNLGLNQVSKL